MDSVPFRLGRLRHVIQIAGVEKTTIWKRVKAGLAPEPVRAGTWPLHEHEQVSRARLRGATDDEIRELVAQLKADRQKVTS